MRNYSADEWRAFFAAAELDVEALELIDATIDVDSWLERAGCERDDAERVRALLGDLIVDGRLAMRRVALKGRKR